MPLYPTFEDLKVSQLVEAQSEAIKSNASLPELLYTEAAHFMGLDLNSFHYNDHGELIPGAPTSDTTTPSQEIVPTTPPGGLVVVPTTGPKGEIQNGLRRIVVCKDVKGKVGVQLRSVDNGIFVSFVEKDSPAALAGLRFGDQIVSIMDKLVAGYTGSKAMNLLRKAPVNNIELVIRDRPFERTIALHKNSAGEIGIRLDNGRVVSIVKDSSAARNGLLTDHQLVEVDGQNVIGLKDKHLRELLHRSAGCMRLTIVPSPIFKLLIKKLSGGQIRHEMDHSIPDA